MNDKRLSISLCACGSGGRVPAAHSGAHTDDFPLGPDVKGAPSRRDFLRTALVGGIVVASIPLLAVEAEAADPFMPSAEDQKKLGDQAAQEILKKYHELHDTRSRNFQRIGDRLVNALSSKERGPWDYRFHVIENKDINAFALPGGHMFMFTGLMDRVHSDDELAAVTGHEMTHVRKQHWARAVAGRAKRELVISGILGAARAGKTWQKLAGVGESLYSLHYSRGEEDEADAGGLQNMVDAGYDPHGMLDLFRTLQASSKGGEPPKFLSDHPQTRERIQRTQDRINRMNNPSSGTSKGKG
jgi:predicted Zn-dependent protease